MAHDTIDVLRLKVVELEQQLADSQEALEESMMGNELLQDKLVEMRTQRESKYNRFTKVGV